MVPIVSLVARVIHYLSLQKAVAILVVPLWPSSSFWHWSLVAWTAVSRVNDTGHVKGRLRPLEKISVVLDFC